MREFAAHGYDVAVLSRGRAGVDGAIRDVEQAGGRGLGITCDVSNLADVRAAADQIEHDLGEIDVWVNVAFVGALRYFWDTSDDLFRRITDVTYLGFVNGTRVALERMRPRDRGVVVQVGSALAFRGIPLQAAYCGAKHAMKGFTESVITELKSTGSQVHVCMVQLPGVNTTQFDWNDNEFDKHPMPVPPINISAAMMATQALPMEILRPATMAGAAAGNTTANSRLNHDSCSSADTFK